MKELGVRAITGAVVVALTLLAGWAGGLITWLLFLPAVALGTMELLRLIRTEDVYRTGLTLLLSLSVYTAIGLAPILPDTFHGALLLMPVFLFLIVAALGLRSGPAGSGTQLAAWIMVPVYVALPFALMPHLLAWGYGTFVLFLLMLWTNDTGAYLVGRAIGRRKLMPAISPGKTVEGLIGGSVLVLAIAAWVGPELAPERDSATWMIIGIGVAWAATVGDLLESALKRAAGVKDSGRVLPGHGGILDRFDGLLLAAPMAWALLRALN